MSGLSSGHLMRRFGRRPTMLFLSASFSLSFLALVAAESVPAVLAGRILTGLCSGAASTVVPTYVAETASPHVRGMLGSVMQVRADRRMRFVSRYKGGELL